MELYDDHYKQRFVMTRKAWTWALTVVVLAGLVMGGYRRMHHARADGLTGPNVANFQLVKPDMPRREVHHLLGCPPGYYATREGVVFSMLKYPLGTLDKPSESWTTDTDAIIIWYNEDDHVDLVVMGPSEHVEVPWYKRALRAVGLE